MSNDANRTLIILVAAAWIVLMAVLIFLTWSADTDVIDAIGDFQEYLADHNDNAGKLIVTLAALVTVVLALLLIILEVAPEEEEKELRVEQAGATTIVPASALRARIEEALTALPEVSAAKAKVSSRDKGIATALDLTVTPGANVATTTQEAVRLVVDTIQTDLGLPVAGTPSVRVTFGGAKAAPVASSVVQRPTHQAQAAPPQPQPAVTEVETVDERISTGQPEAVDAGASPGPIVYEPETPPEQESEPETWEEPPPEEGPVVWTPPDEQ